MVNANLIPYLRGLAELCGSHSSLYGKKCPLCLDWFFLPQSSQSRRKGLRGAVAGSAAILFFNPLLNQRKSQKKEGNSLLPTPPQSESSKKAVLHPLIHKTPNQSNLHIPIPQRISRNQHVRISYQSLACIP